MTRSLKFSYAKERRYPTN